jgi:polyisoprenoid-binding protein YceI
MQVNGELTIRGKARAISTKLKTEASGSGLQVTGRFEIMQSWFGYAPYSALLGALKVSDNVEIVLDIALGPTPVIPVVDEPKPIAK